MKGHSVMMAIATELDEPGFIARHAHWARHDPELEGFLVRVRLKVFEMHACGRLSSAESLLVARATVAANMGTL